MEVNVHHDKTSLSKLIAAVDSGEEVIIARAGKPAVKLVTVAPPVRKSRKHLLGSGIGKIWMAPDAFSPETDLEIQKLFEADDHRLTTRAKQILRSDEHEPVVSLVSLWEIAIKIKTGKLNTIGFSVSYLRDEMEAYGMELLPIRYEQLLQLESLLHHYGDPFGSLLIAQGDH